MRGARVKALRRWAVAFALPARAVRRDHLRSRREKPASAAVRTYQTVLRLLTIAREDLGELEPPSCLASEARCRVAAGFGRRPHAEKRLAAIRRGAEERAERARLEAAHPGPAGRTIQALRRAGR